MGDQRCVVKLETVLQLFQKFVRVGCSKKFCQLLETEKNFQKKKSVEVVGNRKYFSSCEKLNFQITSPVHFSSQRFIHFRFSNFLEKVISFHSFNYRRKNNFQNFENVFESLEKIISFHSFNYFRKNNF